MKPHEACAVLCALTGSTRRLPAASSTTGCLKRRRQIGRSAYRNGHGLPAVRCGCALNATAFIAREATFVGCSNGLLRGNGR